MSNSIDHGNLSEIIVKTQMELDAIPLDFKGTIYVEFGTYPQPAIVKSKYCVFVVARDNSHVVARDNSHVEARDSSYVVARDNSYVVARDNSHVEARDSSYVVARDNSRVVARDSSHVVACYNSFVEAWDNSHVEARDSSHVVACYNSFVEAWDNSHVEAWDNSHVEGFGNSQIVDMANNGGIKISGNSRIVCMPKTIKEYCTFYGIKHNKNTGRFYKCVHKRGGRYFSDHCSRFEYIVGENAIPDSFDNNPNTSCGHGIHAAHLNYVLNFGKDWSDLAIIEVEAKLSDIVVPRFYSDKIRCKKVKVLREVPLEECGVYGKILAKKTTRNN